MERTRIAKAQEMVEQTPQRGDADGADIWLQEVEESELTPDGQLKIAQKRLRP